MRILTSNLLSIDRRVPFRLVSTIDGAKVVPVRRRRSLLLVSFLRLEALALEGKTPAYLPGVVDCFEPVRR